MLYSLHADFKENDLLRSAHSRVRTSRNLAAGQNFTFLFFFPGWDIGARVVAVRELSFCRSLRLNRPVCTFSVPVWLVSWDFCERDSRNRADRSRIRCPTLDARVLVGKQKKPRCQPGLHDLAAALTKNLVNRTVRDVFQTQLSTGPSSAAAQKRKTGLGTRSC